MLILRNGRAFDIEFAHPEDHLARIVERTHAFYEQDLLDYAGFVCRHRPRGMAVDIGANVGNHSVYFGSFVADHVVAIEANPDIIGLLQRNLACNVAHYSIVACAVGSERGRGAMVFPPGPGINVGMARVELRPGEGSIGIERVDDVVAGLVEAGRVSGPVSLIKLDIEGMELQALQGATGILARDRPELMVEAADREACDSIARFLSEFGYQRISRWGHTPMYHFSATPRRARAWLALYRVSVAWSVLSSWLSARRARR